MNVKDILVLLKHHSKKDSGTILETSNKKYKKCTELSKYTWSLKSHGITPTVKWSIVKRVNSKKIANYWKLCLTENFYIIQSLNDKNLLNRKSELVNKCRHQSKLLSSNVKRNDTMDYENCILYSIFLSLFILGKQNM